MADMFHCPHCDAAYPIKPVLVDRPVRCTTCKNVFILRENGKADKGPSPEPAASAEPSKRPHLPNQPLIKTDDASSSSPRLGAGPGPGGDLSNKAAQSQSAQRPAKNTSARSAVTNNEDLPQARKRSARAEAARRSMSSTLKDAAEAALASNAVRKADADEKKHSSRISRKSGVDNSTSTIGPALLNSEGEREAKEKRTNWLVLAGLTLLLGGCSWMIWHQSPEEAALLATISPPTQADGEWVAPHRIGTIQRRTWLPDTTMPAAMNLDDASFQRRYRLNWGEAGKHIFKSKSHMRMPSPLAP